MRVGAVRLRWVLAGVLVAFAADWVAMQTVAADQCGNPDTVRCTTVGWVLLWSWMALAALALALAVLGAATWLWRLRRPRERAGA